jgi:hypothetical protein
MRLQDGWATRPTDPNKGDTTQKAALYKRKTIQITVPAGVIP